MLCFPVAPQTAEMATWFLLLLLRGARPYPYKALTCLFDPHLRLLDSLRIPKQLT
jgi:hypothetical protein